MLIITRWNGVTFYASAFRNADISWPTSKLVRFWSGCVDFLNFGTILTLWNCSNSGIMGIFCTMHRSNGLEIWHADASWPPSELSTFWSCSVDFQILVQFWLSKMGQICGLWNFLVNAWKEWLEIWDTDIIYQREKSISRWRGAIFSTLGIEFCLVLNMWC